MRGKVGWRKLLGRKKRWPSLWKIILCYSWRRNLWLISFFIVLLDFCTFAELYLLGQETIPLIVQSFDFGDIICLEPTSRSCSVDQYTMGIDARALELDSNFSVLYSTNVYMCSIWKYLNVSACSDQNLKHHPIVSVDHSRWIRTLLPIRPRRIWIRCWWEQLLFRLFVGSVDFRLESQPNIFCHSEFECIFSFLNWSHWRGPGITRNK